MEKVLVTIIIPVYNVAQYLPKCLDSVINQYYRNLDIILIEDASTDDSNQICHHYSNLDSRIRLIEHPINKGISFNRKEGIDLAKGEYIFFLDSDDYIELNLVDKVVKVMQDQEVDIVSFSYRKFGESQLDYRCQICDLSEKITDTNQFLNHMTSYLWDKCFKKALLKDLTYFLDLNYGEDHIILIQAASKASAFYCLSEPLYWYRQTSGSLSNKHSLDKHFKLIYSFEQLLKLYDKHNNYSLISYIEKCILMRYQRILILRLDTIMTKEEKQDFYYSLKQLKKSPLLHQYKGFHQFITNLKWQLCFSCPSLYPLLDKGTKSIKYLLRKD